MSGRYYLRSFGCQMNEHDAERIRALLEAQGLERAHEPDAADVLVYNTCTVRKSADDRLAGHLGTAARLKREDPSRVVLVTGCLPQAEQRDFFARFPFVDGALGPQNLHRLPELLNSGGGAGGRRPPRLLRGRAAPQRRPRGAARTAVPGVGAGHERLHQLLLLLHRTVRPRPRAQPGGRRHPDRSLGAGGRRRARGHASGTERDAYGSDLQGGKRLQRRAWPGCGPPRRIAGLERVR